MPVAIITGASRGLGRNAAVQLARRGVDIIGTFASNQVEAEGLVADVMSAGARGVAVRLDTMQAATFPAFAVAVREILSQWAVERIDYLVNNAGFGVVAPISATSEWDLDRLYAVHFKGPFLLTQTLLPLIRDGGAILNVSTGLTRFSFPGYAAYASMKGAVEVLTHYMAKEFGSRRIRVNALAPGAVETDFSGGVVRDNRELNAMIAAQTAFGRVGRPDDIGAAIAMLLTDGSAWITGQRIEASGGMFV